MSTSTIKRNYLKPQLTRELTHTITDDHMMISDGANPHIEYKGEKWGGEFQVWKKNGEETYQVFATDRTKTNFRFWNITTWKEAYTLATSIISGRSYTQSSTTDYSLTPTNA